MGMRRGLVAIALSLVGCYDPGEGVEPPLRQMYFPVGLALSPAATRLYVVNSDFDLQFNGGSLQALDLERIRSLVPRSCESDADCDAGRVCDVADSRWCVASSGDHAGQPCGPLGEKTVGQKWLSPGRCGHVDLERPQDGGSSLVVAAVGISAFATDIIYRPRPTGPGGRLFVPTRGDATLHYIETIDDSEPESVPFELECGQSGNGGDCRDHYRIGDDADEENSRDLRMPPEPFGIAALDDARAIVVTHQTEGAVSLFVNDEPAWGDGSTSFGTGPQLAFVRGSLSATRAIGIAVIPEPAVVGVAAIVHQPGFVVTFRNSPAIDLIRFFDDEASGPERPFVEKVGSVSIGATSVNIDSRGIAVSAADRQACEASCAATDVDCLMACAGIPLGVYVAHRTPTSLLIGQTRTNASAIASDDLPHFFATEPLSFGPSRIVVGDVVDKNGERASRIFAICFDAKRIFVYDPVYGLETTIDTGRGPHAFAVDIGADHALGYVSHFTDSYVGVVQLDQRSPNYGQIVLTVGRPTAPRASK